MRRNSQRLESVFALVGILAAIEGCGASMARSGGDTAASGDGGPSSGSTSGGPATGSSSTTGGSSSTSGGSSTNPLVDASSDVPPTPVIADCDALPASGTWQNITPPGLVSWIDGGTTSTQNATTVVAVDPVNSGTAYFGTGGYNGGQGVWKTTNCGSTWAKIDTGANSMDLDTAQAQWTMVVDPINPQVIYTNAGYGTCDLYQSTNGGVDWNIVWPPQTQANAATILADSVGFAGNLQIDPYNHEHLLLTFHDPCGTYANMVGCFAETTDSGNTWSLVFGNPTFEAQARVYFLDNSNTWMVPSNGSLWRTTDGGNTWTNVSNLAAGGHSAGNLYHSLVTGYYVGTMDGIISSPDGINWQLVANSGQWVKTLVGDGMTIFAASIGGLLTSAESDGTMWNLVSGSPGGGDGCFEDYDRGHNLLYVSCQAPSPQAGIWRVVMQ